jgi:sulfite reductase beta subunit-like hemoprotein
MPVQDFGFVAQEINGNSGFKVYSGGGMGRNSRIGKVLIDFLPQKDLLKAVTAGINLFYDHGNRENRAKARLRFLVEELGFENYKNLFLEYFNKTNISDSDILPINYLEKFEKLKTFIPVENTADFELWKATSIKKTKYKDIVGVELFIKNGDLSVEDGKKLIKMFELLGISLVRATINQNLLIPFVDISSLNFIYNYLSEHLSDTISVNLSPVGQLKACVGCKTCTIGLVDSMGIAEKVGEKLENLSKSYPQYKTIIFKEASNIRFSGCGSSCAGIPTAPLGFIGIKKRIDNEIKDCMQVYIGGIMLENIQALSFEKTDTQLPIEEVPQYVKDIFEEYLLSLSKENLSFAQFMYKKRN